jgi:WD40 repeat protein
MIADKLAALGIGASAPSVTSSPPETPETSSQRLPVIPSRVVRALTGHTDEIEAVAFRPDGRILATGSTGDVRLWDMATGQHLRTLQGHGIWAVGSAQTGS